jgi:hypothetical protein
MEPLQSLTQAKAVSLPSMDVCRAVLSKSEVCRYLLEIL